MGFSRYVTRTLVIAIWLLTPSIPACGEVGGAALIGDNHEVLVELYWRYFRNADFKRLEELYAEKVIVRRRSRLLERGLGEKGDAFGTEGDRIITKAELFAAYGKLVEEYEVEKWRRDSREVTQDDEVTFYRPGDDHYDKIAKRFNAEPGDIFVIIAPKRNPIFLQLRKIDRFWRIMSEEWS